MTCNPSIFKFFRYSDLFKSVLSNQELWFSQYNDFNDPFEFQLAAQLDLTDEDILEYYHLIKKLSGTKIDNIIENSLEAFIWSFKHDPEKFTTAYLYPFEKRLSKFGICCFTEVCDNLLMWSHYADSHKGFVVEFDSLLLDRSILAMNDEVEMSVMDKVKYSADYPLIKISNDLQKTSDSIKAVTFTKSIDWSYEKEVRIVSNKKGNNKFSIDSIISITIGSRVPTENAKEILEILKRIDPNKNISTYYMKNEKRNYKLNRINHD